MATDLTTPSNTLVKMRWQEPYVSEGLNKKLNGLAPPGVIRGGRLGTSALDLRVTVEADPGTGDSIYSFIDSNGHQLTFRQVGDVTLDLTALASTTVYIGFEVTYSVSVATVVKWRAYSQAEIDADSTIVCLGAVDVPASGLIPDIAILGDRRRDGGQALSSGTREWRQVVKNPSFEGVPLVIVPPTLSSEELPGWFLSSSLLMTWRTLRGDSSPVATPRTGGGSLGAIGGGAGTNVGSANPFLQVSVRPGQMVRVSTWVRGTTVTLGDGASTVVGIDVVAYQYDGSLSTANTNGWTSGVYEVKADGTALSGTFDYLEIAETVKMPADAVMLFVNLVIRDTTSFVGTLEFDDFRVWLEPGGIETAQDPHAEIASEQPTRGLIVTPTFGQDGVVDPATAVERSIRLVCDDATAAALEYAWKPVKDVVASWLMSFPKGRLGLGTDLLTTAAQAQIPRLTTDFVPDTVTDFTLLWEMKKSPTPGGAIIRLYAAETPYSGRATAFVITVNAEWTGTQWQYDDSSDYAGRVDLGVDGIEYASKDPSGTSPWNNADWDDQTESYQYFSLFPAAVGGARLTLNDGRLRFLNSTTYTNPANTTTPSANTLYSKNMVKAWGRFNLDGAGGATVTEGFNLEIDSVGTSIQLGYRQVLSSLAYTWVPWCSFQNPGQYDFPVLTALASTHIAFAFERISGGGTFSSINASAYNGYLNLVVLGEQTS